MKNRSKRVAKRALSTLPLVTAAVTAAPATEAKPPTEQPSNPPKKAATPTFKDTNVVAIKTLSIDPALPKAGQTVSVTLQIANESSGPLGKVEWKLSGAVVKAGSIATIGAKGSHTVTHKFKAPTGAFQITAEVDPQQKISEPAPLRRNNKATLKSAGYATSSVWAAHASKVAARMGKLIEAAKSKTSVVGKINGSTLEVTGLKVAPIDVASLKKLLVADGVPKELAHAVVDVFAAAYGTWAKKYRAVVPFAYPGLAAWPGATSAPMPNVPFALAIGGSSDGDQAVTASALQSALSSKLVTVTKDDQGATEALEHLATVMAGQIEAWLALQQATGVMGKGSVPTFAPPYVPVGPVSMGTTEPALSHLP